MTCDARWACRRRFVWRMSFRCRRDWPRVLMYVGCRGRAWSTVTSGPCSRASPDMYGGRAVDLMLSIRDSHAYPVSSATIWAWRGRTFPGRSSSFSVVFPPRQPAAPTSSRPDGLMGSGVPHVDPSTRRRCPGDCSGSALRAAIRSRSLRGRCSTRPGHRSIFGSGQPI